MGKTMEACLKDENRENWLFWQEEYNFHTLIYWTVLYTRDGHGIPKCSPCPSVVFLMSPGPSVRFRVFFLGGEYGCPSNGLLKFLKSAKSGRKSVCPFVKKLRNPFSPKIVKKCLKYNRCDI